MAFQRVALGSLFASAAARPSLSSNTVTVGDGQLQLALEFMAGGVAGFGRLLPLVQCLLPPPSDKYWRLGGK